MFEQRRDSVSHIFFRTFFFIPSKKKVFGLHLIQLHSSSTSVSHEKCWPFNIPFNFGNARRPLMPNQVCTGSMSQLIFWFLTVCADCWLQCGFALSWFQKYLHSSFILQISLLTVNFNWRANFSYQNFYH